MFRWLLLEEAGVLWLVWSSGRYRCGSVGDEETQVVTPHHQATADHLSNVDITHPWHRFPANTQIAKMMPECEHAQKIIVDNLRE